MCLAMIMAGGFVHSWVGPNLFIPGKHGISVMESMVYWVLVLDRVTNNSPVLIGYPVTVFSYALLSRSSVPPYAAGILRQGGSSPGSEKTGHRSSRH